MSSTLSDSELWLTFKNGDKKAISIIYRKYFPELYRYGLKFTPDTPLIEDTIQDLFAELIKNHKTVGVTDNILFYLLKSFRRKLFRKLEEAQRYNFVSEMADNYSFDVIWSAEQTFIRDEENEQRSAMFIKALSKLTARQKEAVYLRFTKELDYVVIAEIMNISIEACRNLIAKAVANLRLAVKRKD